MAIFPAFLLNQMFSLSADPVPVMIFFPSSSKKVQMMDTSISSSAFFSTSFSSSLNDGSIINGSLILEINCVCTVSSFSTSSSPPSISPLSFYPSCGPSILGILGICRLLIKLPVLTFQTETAPSLSPVNNVLPSDVRSKLEAIVDVRAGICSI